MADDAIARRSFLLGAGVAGTAVAAGLTPPAPANAQAPQQNAAVASAVKAQDESEANLTLTATEAAFFSAVADAMIPADALSPSGTDCGLVTFIDRQLA